MYAGGDGSINTEQLFKCWMNYLPVRDDIEEGEKMHSLLVSLALKGDGRVLGTNMCNLSRFCEILAEAVQAELIDEVTHVRISALFTNLQSTPSTSACFSKAWASVNPVHQKLLMN